MQENIKKIYVETQGGWLFSKYIPNKPVNSDISNITPNVPSGERFCINLWWMWSLPGEAILIPFVSLEKISPIQSNNGIDTNQSIVIGSTWYIEFCEA